MLRFALTAFVALIVVVDPLGLIPVFAGLTSAIALPERRAILRRALTISCGVTLFFLGVGREALAYLGVTVQAFEISGGILLFAAALPMLFGQRAALQAPEAGETETADLAVFPLAIPLISGPGTLTTVLLLTSQAGGDPRLLGLLVLAVLLVFAVTWVTLRVGERLIRRMGESGIHVTTRLMGVILASLAVQFVLNGVTGYYRATIQR